MKDKLMENTEKTTSLQTQVEYCSTKFNVEWDGGPFLQVRAEGSPWGTMISHEGTLKDKTHFQERATDLVWKMCGFYEDNDPREE
jgi:hypothetical protein